ncbi:Flp pilus assembly protein CpaB [Pontivivens ytuae]|uniref:Flp pilus assembly protein CpaB n=1 Tax=Pontivivens ytuae TaxID=2789856 RepID=A0A7S9LU43_9RHOB|nr:Flp pilus assembly protein CpaB [Pontivivens ytuae]QPH55299.1 Flp pilus assembly protein CpaB [Pontivivens ytuae]
MRLVFLLFLVAGLGLAGFAVLAAKQRFDSYEEALARSQQAEQQQQQYVPVVVARRQLAYGATLTPDMVGILNFPQQAVNEDWFSSREEIFGESSEPRQVLRVIERGEPIMSMKITGFGQQAGMAARLGEGFRAFTIRVDVASGVSGFLKPSDRVDVFWSGRFRGEAVTRLIIENLELIAIDQISDSDRNRPMVARTITVKVTPEQAATLAQAQSSGALSLSLRGLGDETVTGDLEINLDDVVGYVAPEPVAAPAPVERRTVTIRRGTESSDTITVD